MEPTNEKKGRDLIAEEKEEVRRGQELYAITQMPGWKIIEGMLSERAYHSWTDPRETSSEKEWMWRELNAFHSADVAKQIIESIRSMVARADYLKDVEVGNIVEGRKMKI